PRGASLSEEPRAVAGVSHRGLRGSLIARNNRLALRPGAIPAGGVAPDRVQKSPFPLPEPVANVLDTARTPGKMSAEINESTSPTACDEAQVPGSRRPARGGRSSAEARGTGPTRPQGVALAAAPGARHASRGRGRAEPPSHPGVPANRGRALRGEGTLRVPCRPLFGTGEPHPSHCRGGRPRLALARNERARGA